MKKMTIIMAVLLFFCTTLKAQILRCPAGNNLNKTSGYVAFIDEDDGTADEDSVSYHQKFFFDIPEKAVTDTMMLVVYANSDIGTPHFKLYSFYAMKIGDGRRNTTTYKLSPDSTALSTDHSTEGMTEYVITCAAKDTVENVGVTYKNWADAVCIAVTATTSNQSDTQIFLKLLARQGISTPNTD